MSTTRGRWIKNQIEINSTFSAMLPREFELDLGVEKVPVINKQRFGRLLLESFYMPNPKVITVAKSGSQIKAGPILGLLARGLNEKNARHFQKYFEQQASGLTYVFDESQLNKTQIEGYYFNEDWYYMKVPKPNYVFDRTYPSKPKNKLELPRSVFFNSVTQFSKSEAMKVLNQNGIVVPETFSGTFETAYRNFSFFYLKPDRGSFGQGIYVVRKRPDDLLVYDAREGTVNIYSKEKFLILLEYLQSSGYILQRGIDPIKFDSDLVDFRLHALADPNPRLVFMAARTSGWDYLYTSTPKKISRATNILTLKDQEQLKELVAKVHFVISRAYGPYVEFSLDVIKEDETGKFYVVDLNGKSTRTHPELLGENLSDYYNASQKLATSLFISGSNAPVYALPR